MIMSITPFNRAHLLKRIVLSTLGASVRLQRSDRREKDQNRVDVSLLSYDGSKRSSGAENDSVVYHAAP